MSETNLKQTKQYFIAYSILINAAQHRGFATYQEIAQAVGLPTAGAYMGSQIGQLLGTISENEQKCGRPMLSAICIGTNGKTSDGFFAYAKDLGRITDSDDKETFWKNECQQVYETWKTTYRISNTKVT